MLGTRIGAAVTCGEWVCVLLCSLHLAKKKENIQNKQELQDDIYSLVPSALARERTDHTEPRRKE